MAFVMTDSEMMRERYGHGLDRALRDGITCHDDLSSREFTAKQVILMREWHAKTVAARTDMLKNAGPYPSTVLPAT